MTYSMATTHVSVDDSMNSLLAGWDTVFTMPPAAVTRSKNASYIHTHLETHQFELKGGSCRTHGIDLYLCTAQTDCENAVSLRCTVQHGFGFTTTPLA